MPLPTVAEILKESGLTDEQIKAITSDEKVVTGFTKVISTAAQEREEAERVKRAQEHQFTNEIAPALDSWANKEANLTAERDYYKTMLQKATTGGFVADAPPFTPANPNPAAPTRDNGGRFVPGANTVPGSPAYLTKQDAYQMVSSTTWAVNEHLRLFGAPLPDDLETLNKEAVEAHMPFRQYVEKKYDFPGKKKAIQEKAQKEHDDGIRKEVEDKLNKEWSEKVGNNPNVRLPRESEFSTIDKGVKEGTRPDPLKMSTEQRRMSTRQSIQKELVQ
jgi:hypothetical protein